MSNAPAAKRREKISLGHSHAEVQGSLVSQSSRSQGFDSGLSAVTQTTGISTAVVLPSPAGTITMEDVLPDTNAVSFKVSGAGLGPGSILLVEPRGVAAGNFFSVVVSDSVVGGESDERTITVSANTGATTAAPVINYRIL